MDDAFNINVVKLFSISIKLPINSPKEKNRKQVLIPGNIIDILSHLIHTRFLNLLNYVLKR